MPKRSEAGLDTAKRSEAGLDTAKRSEAGLDTAKRSEAGLDTAKRSEAGSTTAVLSAKGQRRKVVQFDRIPTGPERAALEASGVKLLRYVGDNAFFAHVQGSREAAAAAEAVGAIFAQEVQKEHKLHPMLLKGEFPDYAKFKAPATKGVLNVEPRYDKAHRLPAAVLNRNVATLVAKAEGKTGAQTAKLSGKTGTDGALAAKSSGQTEKGGGQAAKSEAQAAASATEVDTIALYVLFHPDVDLDTEAVEVIHNHGGVVRSVMRTINAAVVWIPQSNLDALAQDDAVQWAEPALPAMEGRCATARWRTEAADPYDPNLGIYGLEGNGVVVMMYDTTSPWIDHPDFGGRVTLRDRDPNSYEPNAHATLVAGIIAGDGSLTHDPNYNGFDPNLNYRGVASRANILSYVADYDGGFKEGSLYTDPGDLEADYVDGLNAGAEIINNSISTSITDNKYSCEWEGQYGMTSMLLDALVQGRCPGGPMEPLRVIFAAGNEYMFDIGWGAYNPCGFWRTIAPPAGAKNIITIGSSIDNERILCGNEVDFERKYPSITSFGPTAVGRIKPDLAAPGEYAYGGCTPSCELCVFMPQGIIGSCWFPSLTPEGQYGSMIGTSSASAVVTGLCALMLEEYKNLHPTGPLPRPSTLKTLLIHNAHRDPPWPGPTYWRGHGYARVTGAIDMIRNGTFTEGEVAQGQEALFYVQVPPDANTLKLTVAWDDAPGPLNAALELVNDLDLVVVSPSGATHYPWTLDPNTPEANAVNTQADHINNVEQVTVDGPEQGLWTIRVTGYSVPEGPQPFSIAFSHTFQRSSSTGVVLLDAQKSACDATVKATVIDRDLDADSNVVETVTIDANSTSQPAGLSALLTETEPNSGVFVGTVQLSEANGPGVLEVHHGDTVTAVYQDAADANGQPAVVQATTRVDCSAPAISDIGVRVGENYIMTVTFQTDEPAVGTIRYGRSCNELNWTAHEGVRRSSHSVPLVQIEPNFIYSGEPNVTYYYVVEAADEANNVAVDANDGSCYSFTSSLREQYYAQLIDDTSDPNLANWSILFRPDDSGNYYTACSEPIIALSTDPNLGEVLPRAIPPEDNWSIPLILSWNQVWLYGQAYGTRSRPIYVGANGYLTFTGPDGNDLPNLGNHFSLPRVSGFFTDLRTDDSSDPNTCSIRWHQTPDRLAVTWWNCYDVITRTRRYIQIEMFFDKRIRISWMGSLATGTRALVGLSEGFGLPTNFQAMDSRQFRGQGECLDYAMNVRKVGNGTVILYPPWGRYHPGDTVHLMATPDPNWHFVQWLDDASGCLMETDVNMPNSPPRDANVTAVFESGDPNLLTVTVAVQPAGGGTVEPGMGSFSYPEGTLVHLTAIPNLHWLFKQWEGDASGTDPHATVGMLNGNKTATAVFQRKTYALEVRLDNDGVVIVDANVPSDTNWPADANSPPHTYFYPSETFVTLTAEKKQGGGDFRYWRIYDPNLPWNDSNAITDANSTIYILMIDPNTQVKAWFKSSGCGTGSGELLPLALIVFAVLRLIGTRTRRHRLPSENRRNG